MLIYNTRALNCLVISTDLVVLPGQSIINPRQITLLLDSYFNTGHKYTLVYITFHIYLSIQSTRM